MIYSPMVVFVVLIIMGLWIQELGFKTATAFVCIWIIGLMLFNLLSISRLAYVGVEAVLDCILILKIFGGDIRIG